MDFAELRDTCKLLGGMLCRFNFSGIKRLMRINALFEPANITGNFTNMRSVFFHADMDLRSSNPLELPSDPKQLPNNYEHPGRSYSLSDWQKERSVCAMVVLKSGKIAYEDYFNGTNADDRRISWSMSKSILSATLGVLNDQGNLPHFATRIGDIVPELQGSAYASATLRNVLNMASGIAFNEDYLDYHSDINRMGRVLAIGGSMDEFAAQMTEQQWTPGQYSHYVSIDTHVLGMVMRAVTGRRTDDLVRELIFEPLGLEHKPYFLTDSLNEPFVLGGLNMSTRDYARFGLLFAQGGQANGKQIVSGDWIRESTNQSAPPPAPDVQGTPDGDLGYGYQWWLPPNAAEGEFYAIGIYGQYIYVNTAASVVIAVNSSDVGFRDGNGAMAAQAISIFRQISAAI